jgi:hypothetical protein
LLWADEATGEHFTEKTVEVTETSEVPTVEKSARLKRHRQLARDEHAMDWAKWTCIIPERRNR